jgi:glycosyltransferase involved in cell wall biosynthesis
MNNYILVTPAHLLGRNMHLKALYAVLTKNGYTVLPFTLLNLFKFRNKAIWHIHWIDGFFRGSLQRFGLNKSYVGISLIRFMAFLMVLLLVKLLKTSIVWSVHNLKSHEFDGTILERWVTKILLHFSDRVTGFNQYIKNKLMKHYGFNSTMMMRQGLYEGCYPDQICSKEAKNVFGVYDKKLVLLMFGGLQKYKGVDILIKSIIAYDQDDIALIIAGTSKNNPGYGESVNKLAAGDPRIILIDRYIPDEEVQCFFRAADYSIYPYRRIANSGAIFLSYTFGVPVISCDKGGVREITELMPETAILMKEPTTDNILIALNEARLKKKKALLAMPKMQKKLSWKLIEQEIIDVFDFE